MDPALDGFGEVARAQLSHIYPMKNFPRPVNHPHAKDAKAAMKQKDPLAQK